MPELPEVESIRLQLEPELAGRVVRDVWYDALPSMPRQFHGLELLPGRRIAGVGRRGKFLIAPLDAGLEMIMHLGMTGSFRFDESGLVGFHALAGDRSNPIRIESPHVRAQLFLDDGRTLSFKDARRFGRLAVVEAGEYSAIPTLATLGPEPLSDDFDVRAFATFLGRTTAPVKAVLMSQRAVAGVGNIYADEALWLARIHPSSRRVGPGRAGVLRAAIRDVLARALGRKGTTFRDYEMVDGSSGRNARFLAAYGRQGLPCPRCGTPLKRILIGGRSTTYCPVCQRH